MIYFSLTNGLSRCIFVYPGRPIHWCRFGHKHNKLNSFIFMKKYLFLTMLAIAAIGTAQADDGTQVINMSNTSGEHNEGTPPEVIYDGGEETLTVELDMTATVAYVEVTDDVTGATAMAAPLAGGENVVPMPALDEGSYTVTVTLSSGAAYEGTLLIE